MYVICRNKNKDFDLFRLLFGISIFCLLIFASTQKSQSSDEYCLPTSHWNENYGIDKKADFIFVGKIQKAIQIGILHGEKPKKVSMDYEQHFVAAILSLKISKVLKGQNYKSENIDILEVYLCGDCDFYHKIIESDIKQQTKSDILYFVSGRSGNVAGDYGPVISKSDLNFINRHNFNFDYAAYRCRDAFLLTNTQEYSRVLNLVKNAN